MILNTQIVPFYLWSIMITIICLYLYFFWSQAREKHSKVFSEDYIYVFIVKNLWYALSFFSIVSGVSIFICIWIKRWFGRKLTRKLKSFSVSEWKKSILPQKLTKKYHSLLTFNNNSVPRKPWENAAVFRGLFFKIASGELFKCF